MSFSTVVGVELLKLRRSKVTWITFAVYAVMVAFAGLFMWMVMNPAMARDLGLINTKAQISLGGATADGPGLMSFLVQMGGLGGVLLAAIIVTFVFGREYTEGMAKYELSLPVPRGLFVLAKLLVSSAWLALLTLWLIPLGWAAAAMLGLPGISAGLLVATGLRLLELAAMALCCSALVAWVAVETRGYFAPLGFAIGTIALGSVFGHTGWGPWVPWTIVGLYSGAAGAGTAPAWPSLLVLAATLAVGGALTIRHEVRADNVQ